MQYQLKTRQICLFLIALTPISKLFIMPSVLASNAEQDLWISALINLALDFLTVFFVLFACKRANTTLLNLLENSLGKTATKIIVSLCFVYFTIKAILPISEQKDYLEMTLYTLKPTVFYFLPFFISAFYLCTKRLKVLGRCADVLWLFTLIGFAVLLSLSISGADFSAILPVGASGYKAIFNGSYASKIWFGDGIYLAIFIGQFNYEKHSGKKILLSYLISALITLLFIFIFYGTFTSIAHRQRFAFTEISKYTTVINNLGRFDYIGIIMILFVNVFAISLPVYFSAKALNYLFCIKKEWISSLIAVAIQVFILIVFSEYYASIEKLLMNYAPPFLFLVGNLLPALTPLLTLKENKYAHTQS